MGKFLSIIGQGLLIFPIDIHYIIQSICMYAFIIQVNVEYLSEVVCMHYTE